MKIADIFRSVSFLFLSYYLLYFSYISFNPDSETVLSSVSFSSTVLKFFFLSHVFDLLGFKRKVQEWCH